MSSIQPAQDFADKVGGIATCHLLNAGTGVAASVAATSVYTGQVWGVVGGGAGAAAFAALGVASGCFNNADPPPDFAKTGCMKTDKGAALNYWWYDETGRQTGNIDTDVVQILSIEDGYDSFNNPTFVVHYLKTSGQVRFGYGATGALKYQQTIGLETDGTDAQCEEGGDDGDRIAPPLDYTDDETGCEWTITARDTYIGEDGLPHVFWEARANNPECGGPFTWWDSPSGGPIPVGPDPTEPDTRPPPPDLPCSKDCPEPIECPDPCKDYDAQFAAVMAKLEEILECACNDKRPPCLEGSWISTRWVSDSPSSGGTKPLRKLFRYRSKSTRTDDELQAYWSAFTWQAGPVCVIHKGAWWGTPQVWAASESEGQRVIRFAAGEAGIDPDQAGEWHTTSSYSPRIGMSGRMRLQEEQGLQWVTRREGASGLPEL